MKRSRSIAITAAVLAVLWMAAPLWAQERSLKIGLLAPLSGSNPDWGKKQAIGLQMALEKINRRGGVGGDSPHSGDP